MNVRGIKLDFSLIQKFISYKIDDLVIEFNNYSGTKYGKEVVDVLSVPEVKNKL